MPAGGVASASGGSATYAVSTRLWDFTRPEPLPDAPAGARPWKAAPFAKLAADLGADAVELDASIPERRFDEVVAAARDHGLALLALEALCPHPAELARHAPRPGLVPLANPDESERRVAVRLHRRVIEGAADVSAPVVVLTLGRVAMPAGLPEPEGERETRAWLTRRSQEAPPFLEAARFALDDLVPLAERLGRTLALAVTPDLAALPSFQELRSLLEDFRGAPLAAWLDAVAIGELDRRGIRKAQTWAELAERTDAIAGVRWSDVRGGAEAVPWEGELDVPEIGKIQPAGAHRVLSLGPSHDLGRVRDGLVHLRKAGAWR